MAENNDDTTTTTTVAPDDTTTTTTVDESERTSLREDQVGAGGQAGNVPSSDELLDSAASASPHADRDPDTKVLGADGKTPAESQEDAKREALVNSKGEQDLH